MRRLLLRFYPRSFREEYGEEWLELASRRSFTALLRDTVRASPELWLPQQPSDPRPNHPRHRRRPSLMETLIQDIRFGQRTLRRRPVFSLMA